MCDASAASAAASSGSTGAKTMGYAGLAVQSIGALSSAYGAYSKSSGDQAAYQYQAQVADNNATMANWQAQDALKRGVSAVNNSQIKTSQLQGTQRASLAARGIDLSQGSALDILSDTSFMGQIDANTLKDNAAKEAWAYNTQASNASANAELLRMRAGNINPAGDMTSSLLTGAGKVASSWYSNYSKGTY
jgi:hypothetical protein